MTGYADIQSAVQTIKLGAKDYAAKPVNPDELLKKMNEALEPVEVKTTPNQPNALINRHSESGTCSGLSQKEKVTPPNNYIVMWNW